MTASWSTFALEFGRYCIRKHGTLALAVLAGTVLAALLALSGRAEKVDSLVSGIAYYAPVIVGLMAMSGIVSDERESGLILLWFQKPGTLFRAYVLRYVAYQALLGTFAALLGLILGTIGTIAGVYPLERALRVACTMVPLALLPAAIVFAFSAWGSRRDATLAFLVIIASTMMGAAFVFDDTVLSRLIMTVVFPLDAFQVLGGGGPADRGVTRAVLIVAGQIAGWTAAGLVGLRYTEAALKQGR